MYTPTLIAQVVLNGTVLSAVYVLVALGFTMVFGIMRVVNFAHGEFVMLGGFAMFFLYGALKLDFLVALILAPVLVAALSLVFERIAFRPFYRKDMPAMIATLGLSLILQYSAAVLWGVEERAVPPAFAGVLEFGGVRLPEDRLSVLVVALVALLAFYLFMRFTKAGLSMRAAAQDAEIAETQGIDSGRVYQMSLAMASLLAGVAGALLAQVFSLSPFMGAMPLIKAFTVVILGGLGSIPGAALGGVILGMSESFLKTYYGAAAADFASFVVVILLLIVRPWGLLGRAEA